MEREASLFYVLIDFGSRFAERISSRKSTGDTGGRGVGDAAPAFFWLTEIL